MNGSVVPFLAALMSTLLGCAASSLATRAITDTLAVKGSLAFSRDDDPELVAAAFPTVLKLFDILLQSNPDDPDLLFAAGSSYVMYANAFVQGPASMLPMKEYEAQSAAYARAKNLYQRAWRYLWHGFDVRYPGAAAAWKERSVASLLARTKKSDVPYLYWSGAAWMAAYSLDALDVELGLGRENAVALLTRVLELDSAYNGGAIHVFFISYWGSLPESMGGDDERARGHFTAQVELCQDRSAGPYIALATSVCVRRADAREFRTLLEQALAIPTDADPDNRLIAVLNRRKARWLLDHIDDYFLTSEPGAP